jgi:type II secretory pathway component PulF
VANVLFPLLLLLQMVTAIGVSLKKALETAGDNPQSEKLKTMLHSGTTSLTRCARRWL